MKALCWKEARLVSDVAIGSLILFAASFPLAFIGVAMQGIHPFPWISALAGGCILNQYTMVLTSALLGAAAFAREREDGSHHFLASLPVSHSRQFLAKILVTLLFWVALWTVNASIFAWVVVSTGQGLEPLREFLPRVLGVLTLSFATLGLAHLAGRFIASVTGAAFTGSAALLAIVVVRWIYLGAGDSAFFTPSFLALLTFAGVAAIGSTGWTCRSPVQTGRVHRSRYPGRSSGWLPANPWRALVWKDLRRLLAPLVAGGALLMLPFVAAGGHALLAGEDAEGFRTASLLAMALGWIVLPLWSGTSLAGEWAAGTHLFLGGLPVSPGRILGARLAASALPALLAAIACVVAFLAAQSRIPEEPTLLAKLSWGEFNRSHFLGGAVAYASALPVTFGAAWFFAARLRRPILAIVLGVLTGPVAMAAWAVTGGPGGILEAHFLPLPAVGLHVLSLVAIAGALVLLGARRARRDGFI